MGTSVKWLRVSPRLVPSATVALVASERPVLIDSGHGDAYTEAANLAFLAEHGLVPEDLSALAITHFHNDHVGGVGALQARGVPVLLHEAEAELIAAGSPHVWDRALLGFDVPAFSVDRALRDGDRIDCGSVELEVIHVPSQTPGHVAFWEPTARVLFSGDLLQAADVGWVRFSQPWLDGALERSMAAIERLAALEPAIVVPGHGPVVTDVPAAVRANLDRYRSWLGDPARPARHAARRILLTTLVLSPCTEAELATRTWAAALAAATGQDPDAAIADLLLAVGEHIDRDVSGLLHARVPHHPPTP